MLLCRLEYAVFLDFAEVPYLSAAVFPTFKTIFEVLFEEPIFVNLLLNYQPWQICIRPKTDR